MNDTLIRLIQHMRWADALFADALEAIPDPDAEAVRLFAHIASVEHLWYSRIHAVPPRNAVWPSLSPSESRALASEQTDLFEQLVRSANDDALSRLVDYRNSAGRDYRSSVHDIVTHTAIHGQHHRGQIARILRASGHEPP